MQAVFSSPLGDNSLCRVASLEAAGEAEPLIALFESIAHEQGWKSQTQLRAYPDSSIYLGLYVNDELAGGLQLVRGGTKEGLPCLTVWPELDLEHRSDVADIALLALSSEHRGHKQLFWLLCIEMWRVCRERGIGELWAEVTPSKLALYRRLGWPLQIAGELRPHWGEECYPCRMTIEEAAARMQEKAQSSASYQALLQQAYRNV